MLSLDNTRMIATGSPKGPFAILDVVGINTAYNIAHGKAQVGDPTFENLAELLKTECIDKGKLGTETGEGFYTYPPPNDMKQDFLKSE
jgi:3-hydroxyacyl-CoA dehydrogenase